MEKKIEKVASILNSMSNETRLSILCILSNKEKTVSEIIDAYNSFSKIKISQPAISQQLSELKEAGLISSKREGRCMVYMIYDSKILKVLKLLEKEYCKGESLYEK